MTSDDRIDLIVERTEGRVLLGSPAVGLLTSAVDPGRVLTPGAEAGLLRSLGRSRFLIVPRGITGRVVNGKPERVHEPVVWGQVLYELEPVDAAAGASEAAEAGQAEDAGGLVVRSPQAGRFWHRPTPADPAFCEVGKQLAEGTAVGLIEVMKTFTHVTYHALKGLPERAQITRVLVEDGEEVQAGQPLIEVE